MGGGPATGRCRVAAPVGADPDPPPGPTSVSPSRTPASLLSGLAVPAEDATCSGWAATGGGFAPALTSHRLLLRQPRHQFSRSFFKRVRHAASAAAAGCAAGEAPSGRTGLLLAGLSAGGPGRPGSGASRWRTTSPKMPVGAPESTLVEAAVCPRSGGDGSRGSVVVELGGAGGSLAPHRFFCRHPRHHRSFCWGPRRARQVSPLGMPPSSMSPPEPVSSCRRRPPVTGLTVRAPGALPATTAASGAATAVAGGLVVCARRRSHPL